MDYEALMRMALTEAELAIPHGDVPVGAVVVADGEIIALRHNERQLTTDPTAHAEVLVIRAACKALGSERLPGHDLYVTLEPCPMCATALAAARIARVYYGAADPKSGGVAQGPRIFSHPQCHHVPEVYDGIGADEAEAILKAFFAARR